MSQTNLDAIATAVIEELASDYAADPTLKIRFIAEEILDERLLPLLGSPATVLTLASETDLNGRPEGGTILESLKKVVEDEAWRRVERLLATDGRFAAAR